MAIFGPFSLDSILEDLEAELGEAIPEMVIEAERLYIRTAWSMDEWRMGAADFQKLIALRVLGNLNQFEGDRDHLKVLIENAALHLPMVGIVQALVEMAYNADSSAITWEFSPDGDLNVDVKVRKLRRRRAGYRNP
jgi:hypothetical protein